MFSIFENETILNLSVCLFVLVLFLFLFLFLFFVLFFFFVFFFFLKHFIPFLNSFSIEISAHSDRFGVVVAQDGSSKSKFTARLRAAPARVLQVCIGLNEDGQRVLQATWNDERDGQLWRDLLRSFALHQLAHHRWLVSGKRRAIDGTNDAANTDESSPTANGSDASNAEPEASSCVIV